MKKRGRVDANQKAVTSALRRIGCSVISLASVGDGCGDILVGFRKRNWLLEIKDGSKPPSKRKLTPDQVIFHSTWQGQINIVCSPLEAIQLVSENGFSDKSFAWQG